MKSIRALFGLATRAGAKRTFSAKRQQALSEQELARRRDAAASRAQAEWLDTYIAAAQKQGRSRVPTLDAAPGQAVPIGQWAELQRRGQVVIFPVPPASAAGSGPEEGERHAA